MRLKFPSDLPSGWRISTSVRFRRKVPVRVRGRDITIWVSMLSVFLSWLIKGLILKYGGPGLYQKGKPFFVGLVIGQFVSMGFWVIVDYFTGMTGNQVYKLIYE